MGRTCNAAEIIILLALTIYAASVHMVVHDDAGWVVELTLATIAVTTLGVHAAVSRLCCVSPEAFFLPEQTIVVASAIMALGHADVQAALWREWYGTPGLPESHESLRWIGLFQSFIFLADLGLLLNAVLPRWQEAAPATVAGCAVYWLLLLLGARWHLGASLPRALQGCASEVMLLFAGAAMLMRVMQTRPAAQFAAIPSPAVAAGEGGVEANRATAKQAARLRRTASAVASEVLRSPRPGRCVRPGTDRGAGRTGGGAAGGRRPSGDCLPVDAAVWGEHGERIELGTLKVGQRVLCFNAEQMSPQYATVTHVSIEESVEDVSWVQVSLQDGTRLTLTANHPVRPASGEKDVLFEYEVAAADLTPDVDSVMVHKVVLRPVQVAEIRRLYSFSEDGNASVSLMVDNPGRYSILVAMPDAPSNVRSMAVAPNNYRTEDDSLSDDDGVPIPSSASASTNENMLVVPDTRIHEDFRPPLPSMEDKARLSEFMHVQQNKWPSVGSWQHSRNLCKPCFYFVRNKCRMGMACQHCHSPHQYKTRQGKRYWVPLDAGQPTGPAQQGASSSSSGLAPSSSSGPSSGPTGRDEDAPSARGQRGADHAQQPSRGNSAREEAAHVEPDFGAGAGEPPPEFARGEGECNT